MSQSSHFICEVETGLDVLLDGETVRLVPRGEGTPFSPAQARRWISEHPTLNLVPVPIAESGVAA